MLKQNKILLILLAVQLVLIFWLSTGTGALSVNTKKSKLLDYSLSDSNGIEIVDTEGVIKLAMVEGAWVLPEQDNFPADQEKAEQLLAELSSLKTGLPVGNTLNAAKKFAVSSDQFERKLVVQSADKVSEIYFGKVPTFKQIYTRVEGEDESYVVNFASHKLPVDINAWFSKDLLQFNRESLVRIKLKDIELAKSDDEWELSGVNEGARLRDEQVESLISVITGIAYTEIPAKNGPNGFAKAKAALELAVGFTNETKTYVFKKVKDSHYLKISSLPYYFKIDQSQLSKLNEWKKSSLIIVDAPKKVAQEVDVEKSDAKKVAPKEEVAVEKKL